MQSRKQIAKCDRLSIYQLARLACDLEPIIVRAFLDALKSSGPDPAFERFDMDLNMAADERYLLHLNAVLSVAEKVEKELERAK